MAVYQPKTRTERLKGRVGKGERARAIVLAVTTAQIVFSIALGSLTVLITFFAFYVASSTAWGDRWARRRR